MKQTKTSKEENERIKGFIVRFMDAKEKFEQAEREYKEDRDFFQRTVRNFMTENEMQKFRFMSPRGKKLSVSNVRPKKVVWLIDRLKENLPKSVLKTVINKTYTVNDWDGFKDYMKAIGADPKVLISFFDVEEEVDESALNEAADQDMFAEEDLEGCYELKESEGYVRITELE